MVETRHVSQHELQFQHGVFSHGTISYSLIYSSNNEVQLQGIANLESVEDINISLGYYFNSRSIMISWMSRKKTCIALIIIEVGHIVVGLEI